MGRRFILIAFAATALVVGNAVNADPVRADGTYRPHDYSAGNERLLSSGMLLDGPGGEAVGRFTRDSGRLASDMSVTMDLAGGTIGIEGTVSDGGGVSGGTITRHPDAILGGPETAYGLGDYSGADNSDGSLYAMSFSGPNNDRSRLSISRNDWPYRVSVWGWLNNTNPDVYVRTSDRSNTVEPVPAPGAVGLGLIGLLTVMFGRRRRRDAE